MRIRVKFTKMGMVKFVGHLDTVRLFQRAINAAGIPIAYSQGFNPHARVYFAMPLAVGMSSSCEYMDMVLAKPMDVEVVRLKLENLLASGLRILDLYEMPEQTESLMHLVDGACYTIILQKNDLDDSFKDEMIKKLSQDNIVILKKNKKKQMKEVDLKPLIHDFNIEETDSEWTLHLKVLAGSKQNLSPDLLLRAITSKEIYENLIFAIHREELYHISSENQWVSIGDYGRDYEENTIS